MHVRMYACMYVCMLVCMYVFIYIFVYMHMLLMYKQEGATSEYGVAVFALGPSAVSGWGFGL